MKNSIVLLILLCVNASLLKAQGTYFSRSRNEERAQITERFRKNLIGRSLADFRFTDHTGNKLHKKDLDGKIVVMNFWFTTCQPCITEMPLLNELVAAYKDTSVVFIAPALNVKEDIDRFLKKYAFNYQIVPDQTGYATKLGVQNFPTHIIADKKGIIRMVEVGYSSYIKGTLSNKIDELLK
jgi:cytochrome oxidase Cu insertion factor (SCO1/SenC/PrrC family)